MTKLHEISNSITMNSGGINYRGALIQGEYYKVSVSGYPFNQTKGLNLQAVSSGKVVFNTTVRMTKKRASFLAKNLREKISNCYIPELDHDK